MRIFALVTASFFFVGLSLAENLSVLEAFNLIILNCCGRNESSLHLPRIAQSSHICFSWSSPVYLMVDKPKSCNSTIPSELESCILNQANRNNVSVEGVIHENNTLVISYTLNCDNKLLYSLPVVVLLVIVSIVGLILVLTIICVIMQNRRKRRLHSCGIPGPESNLRMISGTEHSNKRPVPINPRCLEEARVKQRTIPMEAYENNGTIKSFDSTGQPFIINLPNHPSPQPIYHTLPIPRETQPISHTKTGMFVPSLTHEPPPFHIPVTSPFNFSPPPSPAPVTHKSSVFTFDLPQTFEHDSRLELASAIPTDLPDDFSALHPLSKTTIPFIRDPLFESQHSERYSHRSQSAFTSSDTTRSKQLRMRRGINLTIDLAYETQTDMIKQEKRLDFNRRMSAEQLVNVLISEEDLSIEYSSVAMNNDKVAIPGTGNKNRYADILPNRSSRVILQVVNSDNSTDYINANHIRGFDKERSYIAAQGPMKNTAGDFWRMVIEHNCRVIVMVTTHEEMEKSRCERYWPQNKDTESYGDVVISFVSQTKEIDYIKTFFKVSLSQSSDFRLVTHYWYTTWPDHGVPSTPEPILRLIKDVNLNFGTDHSPIVIHCSAGVGRTGCYIAIDIGQQQLQTHRNVDILGALCSMRRDRGTMIQTFDQYLFVHHALSHYSYTEELISPKLRNAYQTFIASMMSPVTGHPPKFYDSSYKYIDELVKDCSMDSPTDGAVPHHEIPTTPSANCVPPPKSFAFIEPENSQSPTIQLLPPTSTCQLFAFPQTAKPKCPYPTSPLDNIAEISLDQVPQEKSNSNPISQYCHSLKELQPVSFDFPTIEEESPKPKKKNIPQRLTFSNPPSLPLVSPEPLSCPFPAHLSPEAQRSEGESRFFFSENLSPTHSNSASYLTKGQQFNFPDPSKRQRSSEPATAFPFGNLTIRTNPPQANFQFAFSDNNLGRGCLGMPGSESTPYSSFTWPSGIKRHPVNSESPITPRTPTLVH